MVSMIVILSTGALVSFVQMVSMIVISKYGRTSELCSDGVHDSDF